MILPMLKYSFIVFHKDYDRFLDQLGALGVVDVIERKGTNREEELSEDRRKMGRIDAALEQLQRGKQPSADKKRHDPLDHDRIIHILERSEAIREEKKSLESRLEETANEMGRMEPWGDFSISDLEKLRPAGYEVRLFKCVASQFEKDWEEAYHLFHINEQDGKRFFIIIGKSGEEIVINADPVDPGEVPLSELFAEHQRLEKAMSELHSQEKEIAGEAVPLLAGYRAYLDDRMSFREVYLDTVSLSDDRLMVLEGWVPESSSGQLDRFLEDEEVVSLVSPPEEGETPPVELKNSKFSRLFEPISKLFDLPNYGELDLTPYFAPFFMIFFGFALGDAGYGVFFILFGAILKLRAKKEIKPFLSLVQVFGIATIVFGLLSGTFFGVNLIDSGYTISEYSITQYENNNVPAQVTGKLAGFEDQYFESREAFLENASKAVGPAALEQYETTLLRYADAGIPVISSFRHLMQDPLQMFYLAILIGGVQILFAIFVKILNITRRRGFKYALSTVGWLILIITVIVKATGWLEGPVFTYTFYGLVGISGVLILLLNKPGAGIFQRIGIGIWDSYGMVTGFFGDLLSYIRLFALGISSAILGFVFNDISMELLNIPYIGWLLFLVLLIFGHTINLFMATLGGFIHPMRLTFVEFYKNAGFEGGGKKYQPFTINHSQNK